MTDLREALASILKETPILGKESVPVLDALNRILARDVATVEDLPAADISAVDGYALCHGDLKGASDRWPVALDIIAESSAGNPCDRRVTPGTAVRIMTGALVPEGANAIIKIEHTLEKEDRVFCLDQPGPGQGIRLQGESFKKGDVVLKAGALLTPLEIGGLAGLRRAWVHVHRKPVVAVLSTGSELADFHDPLSRSKVMSSNLYALSAQVIDSGATPLCQGSVQDHLEDLIQVLEETGHADVVITSGGTSKGRYDLTHEAFESLGVRIKFSNQARKKGKPTLFGTRGDQLFFALPGNPYAAMLSFDQFVKPVLLKMMGHPDVLQAVAGLNGNFFKVNGHNGKRAPLWVPNVLPGKRAAPKPGACGACTDNALVCKTAV